MAATLRTAASFTLNTLPAPTVLATVIVAAHDLRQQLGDGEAQAGSGRCLGAGGARVLERLEDALQVLLVDADAGVLDLEFRDLIAVLDAERDLAGLGVLDGIGQQIDQNLPQALLVGVHDGGQRR